MKLITARPRSRRTHTLRLPELEHCRTSVLNSLTSAESRRSYKHSMTEFISWYCSEPRLALNRIVVLHYRQHLESRLLASSTISVRLAAVRRLAKRLLLDSSKRHYSVLAIGDEVGFNSKSAFNAAFRKYTGSTPSDFRKVVNS